MKLFPESYGLQSGMFTTAQSRGIATLPGGVPLYRLVDIDPSPTNQKLFPVLVGGVGVFFPGPDGYATFEQNFEHESTRGGLGPQKEIERLNAPKVLEAEYIAFFTAGGTSAGPNNRPITNDSPYRALNGKAPIVDGITGISGRIDLVGITLEIFGPHPTTSSPILGVDRLLQEGTRLGSGISDPSGVDMPVKLGVMYQAGRAVPEGWLVLPHDSVHDDITGADVQKVIEDGIAQAEITRAAIRLNVLAPPDPIFRPGARTKMVLAVSDSQGNVLGLYRMKDATVFSIDVAVAKSRNTGYYASDRLLLADQVDADNDSLADVPKGTAFTNRTIRFLAAPRFPTGGESDAPAGDFSMLTMPGINPRTGENIGNIPLPSSIYADANTASVVSFDAFNASRSFRDPLNLSNQNGIVYFPGSSPLFKNSSVLVGGFGVSGDGVDQDDVVTTAGELSLTAPVEKRADQFYVANVRLPYQKFNRNPLA